MSMESIIEGLVEPGTKSITFEWEDGRSYNCTSSRVMKIYSGRKANEQIDIKRVSACIENIGKSIRAQLAPSTAPSYSHARFLKDVLALRRKA